MIIRQVEEMELKVDEHPIFRRFVHIIFLLHIMIHHFQIDLKKESSFDDADIFSGHPGTVYRNGYYPLGVRIILSTPTALVTR
ncbi:MAG: hypothetical protein BGO78_08150 [Chloroflexi bacterium 44-23]|nr:MAG: hypothetical protein BGO78_08150 [Chloroflexi bacterium 44-23]